MSDAATVREQERLDALARYDVLDTPPEEAFDRITRLARRLFDVPIATVTFVDGHRLWFKSRQGITASETGRGLTMCSHAILGGGEPLVLPDTADDPVFGTNTPAVDGRPIRFYAGVPIRTPDGHSIGTFCAMDYSPRAFGHTEAETLGDLGNLVSTVLELRVHALTDSLTGTMSRRAMREEGERAVALARRHRHDLSCIAFDIDNFKGVNDRYGHAFGDEVLRAVSAAVEKGLRSSDSLARMGGEEFAALLPMTGRPGAMEVAERLRLAVARLRIPAGEDVVRVTASFGVASVDRSTADLDALLARADEALYAAKDDGRNRCKAWEAPPEPVVITRRRVFKAGRIAFNAGRSTIDCTVRSLSEAGASLDVIATANIPDEFKLRIDADDLSRPCRVTARRDKQLEVAFN